MKVHTRREFLRLTGMGAGLMVVGMNGLPVTMAHAAVPTYTGATYFPPAYECMFPPIQGFVDRLKKNSEIMKIDFFDSGTLLKADEQLPALRAGTVLFMFHTTSYVTRTFPILGLLGLPGLCDQLHEHGERLSMESPLWKLINDILAKDNIFIPTMGGGIMEPEYIWIGTKKINTMDDLKGKRIRIVSYEAEEVLKPYGVGTARIPSSEVYLAMQRGTVDAALLNLSTLMSRKMYEQVKYCYKLPVTSVAIACFFMKDKWDKLPDKVKALFWDTAKWYDQNDASSIKKVYMEKYWPQIKKLGIEVTVPTDAEKKDFLEKCQPVWAWWKKQVGEEVGQKAINLAIGKG